MDLLAILIGAVASFLASRYYYTRSYRARHLSYLILSTQNLRPDEYLDRVEFLWDGTRLKSPWAVQVRVGNTGRAEIARRDYDGKPVVLEVGSDSSLIDARVENTRPNGLEAEVASSGGQVTINPVLLNPGNWIQLLLICDGKPQLSVDGRIAGLDYIGEFHPSNRPLGRIVGTASQALSAMGYFFFLAIGIGTPVFIIYTDGWLEFGRFVLGIAVIWLGTVICIRTYRWAKRKARGRLRHPIEELNTNDFDS